MFLDKYFQGDMKGITYKMSVSFLMEELKNICIVA